MAHVFDGTWNSRTIGDAGDDKDDGQFMLTIDEATGRIKAGSKHKPPRGGETDVTGQATRRGSFQHITIRREGNITYAGILIPGNDRLTVGFQNLAAGEFLTAAGAAGEYERAAGQATAATNLQQEQAIWVATKP